MQTRVAAKIFRQRDLPLSRVGGSVAQIVV